MSDPGLSPYAFIAKNEIDAGGCGSAIFIRLENVLLTPRQHTKQESYSHRDCDGSKWIARDRGLGLMCSLGRPDLRATDLLVSNAANGRSQILNLSADGFNLIS